MKNVTQSEKLRIGLLCLLGSIFAMRLLEITAWIFLATLFFVFLSIIWKKTILIFITLVFIGASYTGIYVQNIQEKSFQKFWENEIKMKGRVDGFPDEREKNIQVILKGKIEEQEGKILVILPKKTKIQYGDTLFVKGVLSEPKSFSDFNYKAYLERLGISGILKKPKEIQKIQKPQEKKNIFVWGATLRQMLRKNLEESLPLAHQKIAMGILLGIKSELPKSIKNDFQKSGLMHILVVSGFNVSIVILMVAFLLKPFGRRAILGGSLLSLIFFLTLTGLDPPVLRAVLMGGLTAWAVGMGRQTDTRNVLLLSIVIISFINPLLFQRDIGFFLSIFATLGILLLSPILQKKLSRFPKGFSTLLSVTIAAQISVSGLLLLFFEQLPTIGILSNLITEPIIPFAMGSSFVLTLFGWLPIWGTQIIALPAIISLELLIQIAYFFGKVPPIILPHWTGYFLLIPTVFFFFWKLFDREKTPH